MVKYAAIVGRVRKETNYKRSLYFLGKLSEGLGRSFVIQVAKRITRSEMNFFPKLYFNYVKNSMLKSHENQSNNVRFLMDNFKIKFNRINRLGTFSFLRYCLINISSVINHPRTFQLNLFQTERYYSLEKRSSVMTYRMKLWLS